mmetsp:Transcript_11050/g.20312  ORF Transcript_11050/g.20312 Transcript_11050/m.20312 type:complete len:375 (+) Transcript_11050:30-1154(+)
MGEKKNVKATTFQVCCAICAYVLTSSTLVYSNKFLMEPSISIPAPLLVTWFQCVVTLIMMKVLAYVRFSLGGGAVVETENTPQPTKIGPCMKVVVDQFPSKFYIWDKQTGMATIGMSASFVAMISFTNICLKYVEVSFYQVARGLTPVINSVLSFLLLGDSTSYPTAASLFVILSGYYMGVQGEIKFSKIGTIFGVTSSALCVLYPILSKKHIKGLNDKWAVVFYNNFHAAFMFVPLILAFETGIIFEHSAKFFNPWFWFWMLIAAFLGSIVGVTAVTQIQLTSPLSHNVIGNAKGAAQSILGAFIWNTPLTFQGVLGLLTVLLGSLLYAYTRIKDKSSFPKPPAPKSPKESVELTVQDVGSTNEAVREGGETS